MKFSFIFFPFHKDRQRRQRIKEKLTFSDGLNFGCGFFTAGFIFSVIIIPVTMVLIAILTTILGVGAAGMFGG